MGRKEMGQVGVDVVGMTGRLARFYGHNVELTRSRIQTVLISNPGITSARLFEILSGGEGKGKPHNSKIWGTYKEGRPKKSGKVKLGRKSGR